MRSLHIIPSLSLAHGGPSVAMPLIAQSLFDAGVAVDVATTDDDGPGKRIDVETGKFVEQEHCRIIRFPKQTEFYKVSLPLASWLKAHVVEYDVVHVHALFSFASIAGARAARRAGVPYVVRPLGVLNRYGMEKRRAFLKRVSFTLLEGPLLRHAAAVHFTSEAELQEACSRGHIRNGVVIPLGVKVETLENVRGSGDETVLFLSRLDPKKNLEGLLRAWAAISGDFPRWRLVIAGDGEPDFVAGLKSLGEQLGVANRVDWVGKVEGEQKAHLLAQASVFVLPSLSENFGLAAAEAMLAGKACVFTRGVAVGEMAGKAGCARLVEGDVPGVASGLRELMRDDPGRLELGSKARSFASREFSLGAMGERLRRLYGEVVSA